MNLVGVFFIFLTCLQHGAKLSWVEDYLIEKNSSGGLIDPVWLICYYDALSPWRKSYTKRVSPKNLLLGFYGGEGARF